MFEKFEFCEKRGFVYVNFVENNEAFKRAGLKRGPKGPKGPKKAL